MTRTTVLVLCEWRGANRTKSVRCALQLPEARLLYLPSGNTGSALAPRWGFLLAACRATAAPA